MHKAVATHALCINTRKVFCSLAILSIGLLCLVVTRHRELMTAMDVLMSAGTTAGVSFLITQPQNATSASGKAPHDFTSSSSSAVMETTTTTLPLARGGGGNSDYDWQRSTEENYRFDPRSGDEPFAGEFKEFRHRLDPTYHNWYLPERQALQDTIIRSILLETGEKEESVGFPVPAGFDKCHSESPQHAPSCGKDGEGIVHPEADEHENQRLGPNSSNNNKSSSNDVDKQIPTPWIVFTAGVYGAGKSHTIQRLQDLGCFPPRSSFVGVDPDEIRRRLPEFSRYPSDRAGALTQKEAGMVAELLTDIALSRSQNVVVDGSLRDAAWHEGYFRTLRSRFGGSGGGRLTDMEDDKEDDSNNPNPLRIGILYVTAPTDEIYQRVEQRGASTGRAVPPEFLERSMREVPEAIEKLKPLSDFFLHVHNAQEPPPPEEQDDLAPEAAAPASSSAAPDANEGEHPSKASRPGPLGNPESEAEGIIFQEKCLSIVGYG